MKTEGELRKSQTMLLIAGILSIVGLPVAAQFNFHRLVLVAALAMSSFIVGSMVGFLFTSYGEEAGTVGKVRDWFVGGVTAITVVNASGIKTFLQSFAAAPNPNEYALVVAIAITYSGFGFIYMFVQRELILNVLLAESRAERGRIDGTRVAGLVVQRLLCNIPADILSGSEDVDVQDTISKSEADMLRGQLNSEDVSKFLQQAEEAVKAGNADWNIIAISANLHVYRTYFETDSEARQKKARIAASWLDRALLINSKHVDFTVKRAAIAGELNNTNETIRILEALNRRADAPFFVKQWLGFYLLDYTDRLDESISYSQSYHSMFPDESDSLLNIAAAYGRKYCSGVKHCTRVPDPHDREQALSYLKLGLEKQPGFATLIKEKLAKSEGSYGCLKDDQDFRDLIHLDGSTGGPVNASPD